MIVKVTKVEYYKVPDGTDVDNLEWSAGGLFDIHSHEFVHSTFHGSDMPVIEDENADESEDE